MALRSVLKKFIVRDADISKESWYLAACCSIAYSNRPQDVGCLYKVISDHISELKNKTQEEKNQILAATTLRIKDASVKAYPLIGFPKSMNTLTELQKILPDSVRTLLPDKPIREIHGPKNITGYIQRGQNFFNIIYKNTTDAFMSEMRTLYPDLEQTCMHHAYPVYAEFSVLSPKETSVVILSSNMIQNGLRYSKIHKQGLYNNGATKQEVEKTTSIVSEIGKYYNMPVPF